MKISNLLLGASLLANVALAACLVVGLSDQSSPGASLRLATAGANEAATATAAGSPTAEAWTALRTDDLAVQRDRLRAEGFPPAMIRAILAAQIREGFAARRKALDAARGEIPFWKTQVLDPQTQAAMRAISKEEQKALTDLLGPDPENGNAATLQRQLPNLSADKIAQIAAIRDDYNQRRSDLSAANQGLGIAMSPADRDKLTALDKAMHAEIATALSPQELEDYDLRTSNAANQLRNNLTAFDTTEQEFRTLYELRSAFDDRLGTLYAAPSQDEMRARSEAQKELNDQTKTALGDARYAEYQRATDYNYRQTSQLVTRLELPPETTNQLYAMQQDMQQRVRALQTDRTLTPADRNQQLAALNDEARTKVTATLGDRGFEAYKQYGGQWLQTLQPRPAPAPGAAGIPTMKFQP